MKYKSMIVAGAMSFSLLLCQPFTAMGTVKTMGAAESVRAVKTMGAAESVRALKTMETAESMETVKPRTETVMTKTEQSVMLPDGLTPDENDPDYVKRMLLAQEEPEEAQLPHSIQKKTAANRVRSPFTGLTYTYAARFKGYDILHGIDVSKWQGKIDWTKAKKAGVQYAFIRCGYTELGYRFRTREDAWFRRNLVEAYKQGIRVGVYYFSNAKTVSEAKKEAKYTLKCLKGYEKYITMPVVYDFEAFNKSYRAYGISKKKITNNTVAFFNIIKKAGFSTMYYGSANFIPKYFNEKKLTGASCWLARYATNAEYSGKYTFWQYSSSGHVKGVKGNCDSNFWFVKNAKKESQKDTVEKEDNTEKEEDQTQTDGSPSGGGESGTKESDSSGTEGETTGSGSTGTGEATTGSGTTGTEGTTTGSDATGAEGTTTGSGTTGTGEAATGSGTIGIGEAVSQPVESGKDAAAGTGGSGVTLPSQTGAGEQQGKDSAQAGGTSDGGSMVQMNVWA